MAREPFNPYLIQPAAEDRPSTTTAPLSVSQVTALVKQAIETALPPTIHVIGEISNLKRHAGGHLYLTLKDRFSELACVMWKSDAARMKFAAHDGLEVIATGGVEVFERSGRYQLYIRKIEPKGVGALEFAFRQMAERLNKEGLFDPSRKRRLPACPARIAVVTSPTGAAVSDILRTIQRRFPCVAVWIYPVAVQGPTAAEQIAQAIRRINDHRESLGGVDVMIVGRGGGSLEDLWAFNEEVVARAIYASRIPIISAVGHEVDVTIADLVADVRAATPTAAAELAVPVRDDLMALTTAHQARAARAMLGRTVLLSTRLTGLRQRSPWRDPLLALRRREQRLDEWFTRMAGCMMQRLRAQRAVLDLLEPIVQRIAPHRFLLAGAVHLRDAHHRLAWAVTRRISRLERAVAESDRRLLELSPSHRILGLSGRLAQLAHSMPISIRHRLALLTGRLHGKQEVLTALSYKNVLGRGFSITRTKRGGDVVRSVKQLRDRQRLVTELADSRFESEVFNLRQLELFDEPPV